MAFLVLAGLILLPLSEIAVFIWVGGAIGVLPTILLTVATAIAGTAMLRHQGLSLVRRMQAELDAGRVPGAEMLHGVLLVTGSILLLLPGFITDTVGLLLLIPPLRSLLVRRMASRATIIAAKRSGTRGPTVVDLDAQDWHREDTTPSKDSTSSSRPALGSPWQKPDDRNN
ncbi:FxsA family protein [Pannonibacter tanglangensis]|uniref:FxsA family protein n=1 Tax=Pannonibacter tanglangensis TaxID=2750084 RepID=A0ABW9ZL37_9HYPH|nr:FxsA family protein [Pannonibacter sp. XCT-34]